MPTLKEEKIRELVRGYFRAFLDRYLDEIECLKKSDEDLADEAASAFGIADTYKDFLVSGSYPNWVREDAKGVLQKGGFSEIKIGSESFNAVCHGVIRAARDVLKITGHLLNGEPEAATPKDPLFSDIPVPLTVPILIDGEVSDRLTVGEAYKKYFDHKAKNIWAQKTIPDQKRTMHWFLSVIGENQPLAAIDKQAMKHFRDLLQNLPPNFAKQSSLKSMSLVQLAKANKGKTLTAKTADKYLGFVHAFLKWCVDEDHLSANPSSGVKIEVKESAKDARYPFNEKQLKQIFTSPQYIGHLSPSTRHKPGKYLIKDSLYWAPLLGLYTGMRLGEIGQLLVTDIKEEKGIAFFDVSIGEGEDKKLKTKSAKRRIPIHPILVKLGFLAHVDARKAAEPHGRLFSEIEKGSDGSYSQNPSKKLNRYLARIGVKTPKTTFHSFRHNFKDALQAAGVPESYAKELMGHSDNTVHGFYGGAGLPLKGLAEQLERIEYPVDFSNLQPSDAASPQ